MRLSKKQKLNNKTSLLSMRIWQWPLLLNGIALVGIIAALLGDSWLDWLAWLCLGITAGVVIYAYYAKKT